MSRNYGLSQELRLLHMASTDGRQYRRRNEWSARRKVAVCLFLAAACWAFVMVAL